MITMLLGGIWHGAGWPFLVWGGLHGGALVLNRWWTQTGLKMGRLLAFALTFSFVAHAWIVFRAVDLDSGLRVVQSLYGSGVDLLPTQWVQMTTYRPGMVYFEVIANTSSTLHWTIVPLLALAAFIVFFMPNSQTIVERVAKMQTSTYARRFLAIVTTIFIGAILVYAIKRMNELNVASEFLYFQF